MIRIFDLLPGWIYAAAIAALLLFAGWCYVGKVHAQGELANYRAEVAENTRKAEAEARAKERAMQTKVERIAKNEARKSEELLVRVAAADATARSLRDDIDRLNSRPTPEDPGAAAYAREARSARELFGACVERYRSVAISAEGLVDQVVGLQDFVQGVCRAPLEQPGPMP